MVKILPIECVCRGAIMILVSPISEFPILSEWHCRQSDNRLTLRHPGNNTSAYFDNVGTSGMTSVLATSMVGVQVDGEELWHRWIWGISDHT